MKRVITWTIHGLGLVLFLWAMLLNLAVIYQALGGGWPSFVACFFGLSFLFPLTLAFVPWFALLAYGIWLPLLVTYGGLLVYVSGLRGFQAVCENKGVERSGWD